MKGHRFVLQEVALEQELLGPPRSDYSSLADKLLHPAVVRFRINFWDCTKLFSRKYLDLHSAADVGIQNDPTRGTMASIKKVLKTLFSNLSYFEQVST
jgi:hypothetical protein